MKRLLRIEEVAEVVGMKPSTIRRRIRLGNGPAVVRAGYNRLRVSEEALEAWVASLTFDQASGFVGAELRRKAAPPAPPVEVAPKERTPAADLSAVTGRPVGMRLPDGRVVLAEAEVAALRGVSIGALRAEMRSRPGLKSLTGASLRRRAFLLDDVLGWFAADPENEELDPTPDLTLTAEDGAGV